MTAKVFPAARLAAPWLTIALLVLCAVGLTSCSTTPVRLPYPAELSGTVFGDSLPLPRIFLGLIEDKRPVGQRTGQGHFLGITYPGDAAWEHPVEQLYRAALAQDLTQTRLAEVTRRPEQAAFTLSAEIFSLSCRLTRSPAAYLLPVGAGLMGGMVFGETASDRVKTGAVAGLALMLAVPLPSDNRAECEVRLTLRDTRGEIVWQQACLGEVSGKIYIPVTARDDRKLTEKHLPRAIKRCNACLLGQLRQFVIGAAGAGGS